MARRPAIFRKKMLCSSVALAVSLFATGCLDGNGDKGSFGSSVSASNADNSQLVDSSGVGSVDAPAPITVSEPASDPPVIVTIPTPTPTPVVMPPPAPIPAPVLISEAVPQTIIATSPLITEIESGALSLTLDAPVQAVPVTENNNAPSEIESIPTEAVQPAVEIDTPSVVAETETPAPVPGIEDPVAETPTEPLETQAVIPEDELDATDSADSVSLDETASSVAFETAGTSGINDEIVNQVGTDTIPDPFTFVDKTDVYQSTSQSSNIITVTGIDAPAPISVVGGLYFISGESGYTAAPGTVVNGDQVRVLHYSAATYGTVTDTTLDIGGVTDTFTSVTSPQTDFTPPVITLLGRDPYETFVGFTFRDPGATALDDMDCCLTDYIVATGGASTSTPGDYIRTYTVSDFSGNTTQETRVVRVLSIDGTLNFDAGVQFCIIGGTYPNCIHNVSDITSGSWFSMDTNGDGITPGGEKTAISPGPGGSFIPDTIQPASGSHLGAPDGSESPGLDAPWDFFGQTGMHQTTSAPGVIGTGQLDMSGWGMTWAGFPNIPLGGDSANFPGDSGIANLSCSTPDCNSGDSFTLGYSAHVPINDPSNLGGVEYQLHMEGVVSSYSPVPDLFSFIDATDYGISNSITVTGFDGPAPMYLYSWPSEYSINGGPWYDVDDLDPISAAAPVYTGDEIRVRNDGRFGAGRATNTSIRVGALSDIYTVVVTTAGDYDTPDPFAFTSLQGVPRSTLIESDPVTITVSGPSPEPLKLRIYGGEYSINNGPWSFVDVDIYNNDSLRLRHTSSSKFRGVERTGISIGGPEDVPYVGYYNGYSANFRTITVDSSADDAPNPFAFADVSDVALSTIIESGTITVSGINTASAIFVTGGEYRINGGIYTASAGTVSNGDTVQVRHTSSGGNSTATDTILTIGGVSDTFTSVTVVVDTDSDGVADDVDNCSNIANADQRDTNSDGFGNVCDADLNNDGVVNFTDLAIMKSVFLSSDPDADLDGSGTVNFTDLAILKSGFLGPPGPSGD